MRELNDLMDDVRGDVSGVRLPSGAELRGRVRRRQWRVIAAAAVAVVTAATAGSVVLARPDGEAPPPPPAASTSAAPRPVEIPRSALLRPEDVGAGPDSQVDGEGSARVIRFEILLDACFKERAAGMRTVDSRYFTGLTFLLGTAENRPSRPFVLAQEAYRLPAPEAAAFFADLRAAIASCDGFTQTAEIEQPGGKVQVRAQHNWSVVASGFAGDESILVRHDNVTRNAQTGKVIGESSALSAYLRIGDLVTVLSPGVTISADDLRRFATTAAQRLCATADPPC
ncbi:hypothetical protein [Virgisporangium aurantiacum]|uniref:PknH-like extracellular domain-containing protein n=1 Tax=Virgisporangium aurantiacum TaxID=175570 RepID=A0A8J3Z8J7_9ACTN|nr:hypothetical protein [Virgisporangium aurantiacum]GIJ56915.1 hypothetical protein Vau01_044310 [Virgisporangium aurantiacum]